MSLTYPDEYFEKGYALNDKLMTRNRLETYRDNVNPADYDTPLTKEEQDKYQEWVTAMKLAKKLNPNADEKFDYDMQGFWKNEVQKNTAQGQSGSAENHFTDTYKKPNHRTFSEESKYYNKDNAKYAGNWDKFNKAHGQLTYKEQQKSLLTGGGK